MRRKKRRSLTQFQRVRGKERGRRDPPLFYNYGLPTH
jgi:hypothetical protein